MTEQKTNEIRIDLGLNGLSDWEMDSRVDTTFAKICTVLKEKGISMSEMAAAGACFGVPTIAEGTSSITGKAVRIHFNAPPIPQEPQA